VKAILWLGLYFIGQLYLAFVGAIDVF
jgi:hypothetical protein